MADGTAHEGTQKLARVLRSRRIEDPAASERIEVAHLAEAVQYRPRQIV